MVVVRVAVSLFVNPAKILIPFNQVVQLVPERPPAVLLLLLLLPHVPVNVQHDMLFMMMMMMMTTTTTTIIVQ